jgi:hypothetical protein
MNTNYSYDTSLQPYKENQSQKKRQCDEVLRFVKRGANNLLQVSQLTGLPQSTIAGRINDLIEEERVKYEGFTIYSDRKRKRIIEIRKEIKVTQQELFN